MIKPDIFQFDWDELYGPEGSGRRARVFMEIGGLRTPPARELVQFVDNRDRAKAYAAALNEILRAGHQGHPPGFHWTQGLCFKRAPDASVWIFRWDHVRRVPTSIEIIDEASWASIVCSVSAGRETGERWTAARDFHGRPDGVG